MQQIKGTILKSRLAFVEQHWGREGAECVVGSLPAEDQRALRSVLTVGWYPFQLGERLDAAIVEVLDGGRSEVFEHRLGRRGLATLHKQFLSLGRPTCF
jgi:hypothetical protein